jgi:ribonuclease VapC
MTVDTSVLVALIKNEPEGVLLAKEMEAAPVLHLSAASYFEAGIVIDGLHNPVASARLDEIVSHPKFAIEPVTVEQARIAREAYRNYGKGSGHKANLNFGDCFSYALARVKREPILFKGDDFQHTDLRSALDHR